MTNTVPRPTDRESKFVEALEQLVEPATGGEPKRGALAALRRGLGHRPGEVAEIDPFVLPPLAGLSWSQEPPFYLVAGLFAYWHQGKDRVGHTEVNFGGSMRELL